MKPQVYSPGHAQAVREPARYRLAPDLMLIPQDKGGVLLALRPLLALRLNSQAFALLSALGTGRSAVELAFSGLGEDEVTVFLDGLVRRRLATRRPGMAGEWPVVSVIIPARGRPQATRACVRSLLELDYPQLEIIVVDDASEPPLAPHLEDLPIRMLRLENNIGQSAARNLAAAKARGALLAFIDNDCVAEPGWLRSLVPYFADPMVGIVGGRVLAPPATGAVAAFEAVRSPLDMGTAGGEVGPQEMIAYLPTCNLLVRRELLLDQQGFDAAMRLGEDVDFIWRVLRKGARVCYVPDGRIIHYHRVRLAALLGRRADYGSSEAELQQRHPQGRRIMYLPLVSLLGLAAVGMAGIHWPVSVAAGALALAAPVAETLEKTRKLGRLGVHLPARRVAGAILREHGAALYHLSANMIRYYGLVVAAAGLLWPAWLPVAAVLLLVAPVCDHRRLRPNVSLFRFVGLYWLEMAAYQIGVWRGCIKGRTLRPLLPRLRLRR